MNKTLLYSLAAAGAFFAAAAEAGVKTAAFTVRRQIRLLLPLNRPNK